VAALGIYNLPDDFAMNSSFCLLLTLVAVFGALINGKQNDLEVIPHVDLNRYVGRWYEIARLPNRFETKCAASVTATYSLRKDGRVEVVNRCRKSSGHYTTATGKAKVVDKATNAKLTVSFFWPFYGDYWILDLGDDYEYAVVGAPNRKYLWILSRKPQMHENLYRQLLAKMAARGFKIERLMDDK
jgi:apolipoprotein D and lipocalin family protein